MVIPICTFFFGVLITILLKRYELKKAALRQLVESSSKAASAWYKQLHDINVKLREGIHEEGVMSALFDYVYSREARPELEKCIVALKKHRSATQYVRELEEFLKLLIERSEFDRDSYYSALKGYCVMPRVRYLDETPGLYLPIGWLQSEIPIQALAAQLQRVQCEAGRLLS